MVLTIAECAGRTTRGDKRKHYGIARGSAIESSAALDIGLIRELAAPPLVRKGPAVAVRVRGIDVGGLPVAGWGSELLGRAAVLHLGAGLQ